MSRLPADIDPEILGQRMLNVLQNYGFGVLGKSDLEAALLDSLLHASPSMRAADSYGRAEMLRITDQKYRTVIRRADLWLSEGSTAVSDPALFAEFLSKAIQLYAQNPDEKDVRVVIDDEMTRRNVQRALERAVISGLKISLDISLTGRSLILRGTDLDRMIDRVGPDSEIDPSLRKIIQEKKDMERRKAVLEFLKKAGAIVLDSTLTTLVNRAMAP